MRRFTAAVVLSLVLAAIPTYARAQAKPATPAPAPAAQAPAPAKPFPADAKVAFIVSQRVLAESADGKAAQAKLEAVSEQKRQALAAKQKQLDAAKSKLTGGGILSADAQAAAQREAERLQKEIERDTQDASAEVDELQQTLLNDIQKKLQVIVPALCAEKGLHALFDRGSLAWADASLDLTGEVVKRLDAMGKK